MNLMRVRSSDGEQMCSPVDAAAHVLSVVQGGGLAVVPLDVSYAFLASERVALQRIFELKLRPLSRPCPILASWDHFCEITTGDPSSVDRASRVVGARLPVGIITPAAWDSPIARRIPEGCTELLVRDDRLALFMNMGGMSDELIQAADERGILLFGSSANISGKGNSFSLADVPDGMLDAVDVVCDGGDCKYANPERMASTIIDLETGELTRRGILHREIAKLLAA